MIRNLISLGALLMALLHLIFPDLTIDAVTVSLLIIAILPWLGALVKSIELPGGMKIEYQELKAIEKRIREGGLINDDMSASSPTPLYARLANEDPNLALAGLRIEIEKELINLSERKGISVGKSSIRAMAHDLASKQIIGAGAYLAVADLTTLLNSAAHGAKIEEKSLAWALAVGPQLLSSLRGIN